ncbi:hypothetical protein CHS0354_032394 [Potamilus streckersoni]|uniref:Inositol-1-monophosphatase n=1 Tax=Potamilus streckersoni TaxID=2493646 RepID=A0AAE0WDX9_9BIVA|nr:hypothetical protein CHS0354_032394 [Potamilus streckersoni]
MDHNIHEYYETAIAVAKEAGEVVKDGFYKEKKVDIKTSFADLVTETDQAVEQLIMSRFSSKFPTHKFIGEETVAGGKKCEFTDDPTWIVDPIDGTMNFVHGIPHVSISIALAINKEIVVGIVHCPILDTMYTSMKGQGAMCNGKKISVSKISDLSQSVVIIEGGNARSGNEAKTKSNNHLKIIQSSHGIRAYGSAAIDMCLVARGQGEAYIEYGIHIWDIAAGILIVQEAGGVVVDPKGGPVDLVSRRVLCASSKTIAGQISAVVEHIDLERD